MTLRICTPVIGRNLPVFLENLKKTQQISDLVELRVDYIEGLKANDIDIIYKAKTKKAILTCRPQKEGGKFDGTEEERISILKNVKDFDFEYIDVELETLEKHKIERNNNTKLITSYHNFQATPSYWDMQKIIHDMNAHSPDIIKIATMINHDYEVAKIYRLLTNKPHDEERIVIGMGEVGKMTRILGPMLGGYLTYAATDWGESAPGQINIQKLEEFYKSLNN